MTTKKLYPYGYHRRVINRKETKNSLFGKISKEQIPIIQFYSLSVIPLSTNVFLNALMYSILPHLGPWWRRLVPSLCIRRGACNASVVVVTIC